MVNTSTDKIKICSYHQNYQVPLIWTFAFIGCEYWCPYCGYTDGMLEAGMNVTATKILKKRLELYTAKSMKYLKAVSALNCDYIKYPEDSGMIIARKELPIEFVNECKHIADTEWQEFQKVD